MVSRLGLRFFFNELMGNPPYAQSEQLDRSFAEQVRCKQQAQQQPVAFARHLASTGAKSWTTFAVQLGSFLACKKHALC
eukprot:m.36988 g.36988  ORF g.36988 m.36988 type:complete len:79 (+) comp10060_c0_seq1:484-720(+)